MEKYKEDFIRFLLKTNALKFGEFTLKSGRKSPYFVNTGSFDSGDSIAKLGFFYASEIKKSFGEGFDVIFGPAYKGIPLAVAASASLARDFRIDKKYSFDRKELKDHAEKGAIVGYIPKADDRIILIDDVMTTGKTKYDIINVISGVAKVRYTGLVIAVDRQEANAEGKSAIREFESQFNIPVKSIVNIREILAFLHNRDIDGKIHIDDALKARIDAYLQQYGVKQ